MADLGANALYDGMTIHPYSGTPNGASDEAWYDDAMKKAENTGIGRVQEYVDMLPEGKVPVISEFGIFRDTNTKVALACACHVHREGDDGICPSGQSVHPETLPR